MRETLPDGILALADEVILIDVTPETLRQRLREGKIYPPDRCEAALANFFRTENLFALRELALREALRARHRERIASPFERILLAVGSRADRSADDRARRPYRGAAGDRIRHRARRRAADASRSKRASNRCAPRRARRTSNGSKRPPTTCRGACSKSSRDASETTIALAGTQTRAALACASVVRSRLLDAGARELLVLMRSPEPPLPSSLEGVGSPIAVLAPSRARLSSSTLTRGSPRKPNVRPRTCCATSASTAETLM